MGRYNSQERVYLLIVSKIFADDAISRYQSRKVSSMEDSHERIERLHASSIHFPINLTSFLEKKKKKKKRKKH